jgi:signal transduction histidine kinase/ActR/RegA family two-component response regulator
VPRLLVVRALTEFPLYVVTSVDGAEVLRKWRVNAVIFSAVGALFCLVVLALGYWSGWTYMHQKELLYQARRARDATESAERSKLRFVSLISHDLRTPLTALIGGAEMIERGQPLDERRRYLDLIKTSAGQVLAMVDGILNLSASDVRGGRAASTPFVVRDVINANLAIGSVGALAKGINLDSEIAEAVDEPVLGDPAILSQILLNVLSNAIKYTPTGSVTVVADMTRESDVERVAVISVVDTGPVIPSVYRDKLFDPFERGERTSDPNPDGHGLGLSVVRQLLTIVGGEISVDSAIGVGSTFTMRIPYMRAPAASAQSSASQASSAPLKILVADDVMSIQLVVRGMLQKMGHEVTCVANGALALAAARAEKFDLILMDIQMPEMDGLEATRRIRQLPGYRVVPIVAMTGLDRDGDRDAATLKIMDGYLRKPLGYDKLAEAIAETRRDNNAPRAGAAGA